MVKIEGNIVATYKYEHATVYVSDAAYAGKTEEELEKIRREARRIACGIIERAARRGVEV